MKKIFLMLFLAVFVQLGFAQQGEIMMEGIAPNLYLLHIVQPKENWYSIGRLYNASPKEIAPFNRLTLAKSLDVGEMLKIPLSNSNLSANGTKAHDEVLVPLYYIVKEKEWMYRICVNHGVSSESIEKWNAVNNGQIKAGMKLIVGYLKVRSGQSALASGRATGMPVNKSIATAPPHAETHKPELKEDHSSLSSTPVARNEPPKEEPKPAATNTTSPLPATLDNNGGYFKSHYAENGKHASGAAGVFKSTSGWNDGKYYALMNNVPVGTVVRITNPASGKAVYAKVLGSLPDMKESVGLAMRISDAAAAELGAGGSRFGVDVKY
jgi:LysM repeat protein